MGERRPVLGVDTESGGLRWWCQRLRLVQIGDANTGWAVPWEKWGGVAKELLEAYDREMVGHNMKHDQHFLNANGVFLRRHLVRDTLIRSQVLSPTAYNHQLKPLAAKEVHPSALEGSRELKDAMAKNGWTWDTVPIDLPAYWVYGALDPVWAARLWEHQEPRLGPYARVLDVEDGVAQVLQDMETRGMRLDVDYCLERRAEWEAQLDEVAATAWSDWRIPREDLGKNARMIRHLHDLGLLWSKTTEKGALALDEDVLSSLGHPLALLVLRYRSLHKRVHTYLDNWLDLADGDLLHPSVRQVGARTRRMSITDPALQTIEREAAMRNAFVAREGHQLVMADYSQMEMRRFALYCQDPALLAAFESGEEIYTTTARILFDDPSIEKADKRRQVTKSTWLSKIYGSGTATFAHTAGVSLDQAQRVMAALDRRFPGVRRFQNEVTRRVVQRERSEGEGYVIDILGGRHPIPADLAYKAINYLIQGGCAAEFKGAMMELDAMGVCDYLVCPVHDEMIFDVPRDDVPEVVQLLSEVMPRRDHSPALEIEVGTTDRWGRKYE